MGKWNMLIFLIGLTTPADSSRLSAFGSIAPNKAWSHVPACPRNLSSLGCHKEVLEVRPSVSKDAPEVLL